MSTARIPRTGRAEAVVDATPEQVWAVLSDVTRIGEWSNECRGAEWLDGATGPAVGARFRGHNSVGRIRWTRVCTVTEVSAPHTFAYRTRGAIARDSTAWMLHLEPAEDRRTRITMSYRLLVMPRVLELIIVNLIPAHDDRSGELDADLVRLGQVAASGRAASPEPGDARGRTTR